MRERILENLKRLFEKHRVVFWYDDREEMAEIFENLELPQVQKRIIANNVFGLKYEILRKSPNQKFLLFHKGKKPDDSENWLLDLYVACGRFQADREAFLLADLGLGLEFMEIIQKYAGFFRGNKRKDRLKEMLSAKDRPEAVPFKMLAVCVDAEADNDLIAESLLSEFIAGKSEKMALIEKCGLEPQLWESFEEYGYKRKEPKISDFALFLFEKDWENVPDNNRAGIFMKNWKRMNNRKEDFRALSVQYSQSLDMEGQISGQDVDFLLKRDTYACADKRIISLLAEWLEQDLLNVDKVERVVEARSGTFWYNDFQYFYEAFLHAVKFLSMNRALNLYMRDAGEAVKKYQADWYRIDQEYRLFHAAARKTGESTFWEKLKDRIDNIYVNNFLRPLADNFQKVLPQKWYIKGIDSQPNFYAANVRPLLTAGKKVCVIISDALRFEAGQELAERLARDKGITVELSSLLSMLPSYTQTGMAALLPNDILAYDTKNMPNVLVNGHPCNSTKARDAILKNGRNGIALQAKEVEDMTTPMLRNLVKQANFMYIYHNVIDETGENPVTEGNVFQMVENALESLRSLILKLGNSNVTNMILVSDHGFLYQNQPVAEDDFIREAQQQGELYRSRRFILGEKLAADAETVKYSAADAGMEGDVDALIPFGMKRFRIPGGGSRFAHGGACLQEVIVPLLRINKKGVQDVAEVTLTLLDAIRKITTNQITLKFGCVTANNGKFRPTTLQLGFYGPDDILLSNIETFHFDYDAFESACWNGKITFIFNKGVEKFKGKEVYLRLSRWNEKLEIYEKTTEWPFLYITYFVSDFG